MGDARPVAHVRRGTCCTVPLSQMKLQQSPAASPGDRARSCVASGPVQPPTASQPETGAGPVPVCQVERPLISRLADAPEHDTVGSFS